MDTKITHQFLQEHFRKHDTITLYKPNGAPAVFSKKASYVVTGGGMKYTFKDYDSLKAHYDKNRLSTAPVISVS